MNSPAIGGKKSYWISFGHDFGCKGKFGVSSKAGQPTVRGYDLKAALVTYPQQGGGVILFLIARSLSGSFILDR